MNTRYTYELTFQPDIKAKANDRKLSCFDLTDKDKEPVAVVAKDPLCTPYGAANKVVKNILQAEWEKIKEAPVFPPEDGAYTLPKEIIPPKLRPHHSGGAAYFVATLRNKLSNLFQRILDEEMHGLPRSEFLNIEWGDVDDESTIHFFFTNADVSYEGEDWEERGRLSEYGGPMSCGELQVMYEGVSQSTFIQLLDSGEDAHVRHYRKARVFFTTREGKLISFIMVRREAYWEAEEEENEALKTFLDQSGMRLYELSYLLEAHVRWVTKRCDMPVIFPKYVRYEDELFLRDEVILFSGTGQEKSLRTLTIAPGVYKTERHWDEKEGKTVVRLLVAHAEYAEDFFSQPSKRCTFKEELSIPAGAYFFLGDSGLEPRIKEQEKEFLPFLMSRITRRFCRPGICNYLGVGYGVKLRNIDQVSIFTHMAHEGSHVGEVVAFTITL